MNDILVGKSLIASGTQDIHLHARYGNRHGWGKAVSDAVLGSGHREGMLEAPAKSAARNAGGQHGRSILRGVLGSILKK